MDSLTALDTLIVTPRPLADYRNMFLLTDDELRAGPILDCPGGASPFGAQVRARGGSVISVDPTYDLPHADLAERIAADMARLRPWMTANLDAADWTYLGSPDALLRNWELAIDFFLADHAADRTPYVPAALPSLPFPDNHFRLALSSHLLFTYPDFLSFELHVASLLELARVTDGEVRVFPLVDTASVPYPRLDEVREALREHGIATEIRTASCAYNVGGDQMLALKP